MSSPPRSACSIPIGIRHCSRAEIESYLRAYLGVEKVIWIPRGVFGDETDGHIDNLACFSRPGRVLLTWSEEDGDPQAGISPEARTVLESVDRRPWPTVGGRSPAVAGPPFHDSRGGIRYRSQSNSPVPVRPASAWPART